MSYVIHIEADHGCTISGRTFDSAEECIREVVKMRGVYLRNNMPMTPGYHVENGCVWRVHGSSSGAYAEALPGHDWEVMVVRRSKRSWRWSVYVEALTKEDAVTIAQVLANHNVHYISDRSDFNTDCNASLVAQDVSLVTAQAYCLCDLVSMVKSPHNAIRISDSLHNYIPPSNLRRTLMPGDSVLVSMSNNKWRLFTALEVSV